MVRTEWSPPDPALPVHGEEHTVPAQGYHPSAFSPQPEEPVQIKNQDLVSHRLRVSHKATKHFFHKI